MAEDSVPHCPKCRTKPKAQQYRLTSDLIGGLKKRLAAAVEQRLPNVYRCGICGAVYASQHGFSSFLGDGL